MEAKLGFSADVDRMLINAAQVNTCPARNKCVILLLDEMHIREQLIFDKHSGAIIGYTNISDIVTHLNEFESQVDAADDEGNEQSPESHKLAKTMMVFMVRGLFSSLQFPYAQFACADITGEMLYDPFWEAVRRIEACGLKVATFHCNSLVLIFSYCTQVLGATLDGCSVNRRLIKVHNPNEDVVHKVANPFSQDKRSLYFFADPPHLIKTVRNCWNSKCRSMWVC